MVVDATYTIRGHVQASAELRAALARLYPRLTEAYVDYHGPLHDRRFPDNFIGLLALHEKETVRWGRRRAALLHLNSVCNATDPPVIRKLGYDLDQLLIDARTLLGGQAQRLAIEQLYSVYSAVFTELDAYAGKPSAYRLDAERHAALRAQVDDLRTRVSGWARQQALGFYLLGMLLGLVGLGAATAAAVWPFPAATPGGLAVTTLLGTVCAGGVGALLSVMTRMAAGRLRVNPAMGKPMVTILGAFRPLVGALSGAILYLFLQTRLLSTITPLNSQAEPFYWAVAVLAGFSERWVPDMLSRTAQDLVPQSGETDRHADAGRPGGAEG